MRRRDAGNRMLRRVLQCITPQLGTDGLRDVDLAVLGHLQQVEQHVGDLFADALARTGTALVEREYALPTARAFNHMPTACDHHEIERKTGTRVRIFVNASPHEQAGRLLDAAGPRR